MQEFNIDDVNTLIGGIITQHAMQMKRITAQIEALQKRIQELEGELAKEKAPVEN